MPYQLEGAHVRSKDDMKQWTAADLSSMPINQIFLTYSKVYLTLSHTALNKLVYLDLDAARAQIGLSTIPRTIPQWLAANGNGSLPTVPLLPDFTPKIARYADVWRAGYDAKRVALGRSPNSELNEGDKHDMLLTKPDLEYLQYGRFVMATVNGFFHRMAASEEGFYVIDGGRSSRIAQDNQIGMHDFRDVGTMDLVPITLDMVYKNAADQQLGQYAYIKLPYDVSNKTVAIVIGGYLHVLDGSYKVIGERTLRVDFNNFSLVERLYASQKRINLEPLGLQKSTSNEQKRSVADVYSDKTIRAYLTLPQSFLVIFNTDSMYVRRHAVENMELPGRYMCQFPMERLPLYSALGQCLDYRAFPKDNRCVLACDAAATQHYNFDTWNWKAEVALDDTRYSALPFRFADAYLLEVGRSV